MSRKLIVNDGRQERALLLVGTLVVGRDPVCDISHGDALLSRRHAEFIAGPDGVFVRDLGSRNGIFVNGVRIAEGSLRSGDTIQIGHLQLQFVEDGSPVAASPEMADGDATAVFYPPAAAASLSASGFPPASPAAAPPAAAAVLLVEDQADQTSLVPPPDLGHIVRSGTGSMPPFAPVAAAAPSSAVSHPGLGSDENDQTRVVAAPELRAAIHMAMAHPAPSPAQAAAQLVTESPAGSGAASSRAPSAAAPPASPSPAGFAPPSRAAIGPWPTFVQARIGAVAGTVVVSTLLFSALGQPALVTALLTIAVGGVAAFVVSAMIIEQANQIARTFRQDVDEALEGKRESVRDVMGTAPSQELASALNLLVARVRAAGGERR